MTDALATLPALAGEALAATGGEFNGLPIIIGAVALVVLGGIALVLVRRRGARDD